MTDKQPNALALADALETFHNPHDKQAAAELRRLHDENEALKAAQYECGFGAGCCYQAAKSEADEVLLRQALEALEALEAAEFHAKRRTPDASIEVAVQPAITALRAALAEQQEPVAWMCSNTELMHKGYQMFSATRGGDWNIPVYTAPQPRRRLTDEEIAVIYLDTAEETSGGLRRMKAFARAIERAHGIGEQE